MTVKPTYEELEKRVQELEKIESEHKYSREALQESESLFKVLYEKAPLGYQSLDENGHFLVVNQTWLDTLGYTREEVIGKSFADFLHPDWRDHFKENFPRFKSIGEVLGVEFEMVKKNGNLILVSFTGKISRDIKGTFQQTHCVFHDITERKQAEIALKESEQFLQSLLESIPLPVFYKNVEGRYKGFNNAFETFFGRPKSELIGCSVFDINPPELARIYHAKDIELFEKISTQVYDSQVTNAYGELRDVVFHKATLTNTSGAITGLVGAIMDVTELKRVEAHIKALSLRHEAMLDAVPEIIMEVDTNKIYTWANAAGLEFFGKDVLGKEAAFFFEGEQDTYSAVQPVFNGHDDIIYVESWQRRKDGEKRLLAWWCRALKDERGQATGALSSARDITESKRVEEALHKSEERFLLAMKASNDGLFDWNLETNDIYYSPGWKNILGYEDHELPNDFSIWENTTDPEDVKKSWELQQKLISKQIDRFVLEFKMKHKDGHWVDILSRAGAILNDSGKAVRIVGTHVDITERKRIEEELRKSEDNFRTLSFLAPSGIYLCNAEGRCQYANPRWCEMAGLSLEDALGDGWVKALHPEDRDLVLSNWQQMVASEGQWGLEYRFQTPAGKVTWVYGLASPQRDAVGNIIAYIGVNTDITERKRTEETLIASEERLRTILQTAMDGFWLVDMHGRLLEVNETYCQMSGYNAQELLSMSISDLEAVETADDTAAHMRNVMAQGEHRFESRHRRKDGRIITVEVSVQYRSTEGGRLVAFLRDITERMKTEEALKRIEWMLSTTPSSSLTGDFADSDGDQGYGDLTALNHCGRIAEAIDKHVLHSIASEYLDLMGTSSAIYEKNGDYAYGIFSSSWCRLMDRASRNLCHTEDNRTALKCGKWLCHESCWTICSKQAIDKRAPMDIECNGGIRLYAVPIFAGEEIIGAINFGYGDPPKDLAKLRAIADSYELDLEELILEARNYDSRPHFIIEMAKRRLQVSARLIGILVERKRAEQEKTMLEDRLQQAQRMESIGSLAGGIAHDLNNILFPISGLSEMLLDEIPPGNSAHENIEQIYKSAQRGSDLVKQILAFSRQSNPQKLPIRIQPILKEVLKLSRATIPMNIEITSHIKVDCGMVSADPSQVHQIAMNLITNAYHAVEINGGTINIELKETELEKDALPDNSMKPGKYACIIISDTGIGINQELISKIFEPYFTTKELGKGTGLGLSVVHGIVLEHGGDIRVYSEPGKGTAFHVYLPLLEDAIESKTAAVTREYPKGCENILLVDDEEPIIRMEQMMLERLGYQITTRMSSPDALTVFKANPSGFDLVISDRGMPNMTGEQLTMELITIRPNIPVILCTGFSDENDEKRAMDLGVKGFLKKPVARGDLAEMVRKVLDEAKNPTSDLLSHS